MVWPVGGWTSALRLLWTTSKVFSMFLQLTSYAFNDKKNLKKSIKKKIPWKKKANGHFDNLLKCVFTLVYLVFCQKYTKVYLYLKNIYNKLNFKKLYIKVKNYNFFIYKIEILL